MAEPQIVPYCMCEVAGQDVRLEWIDVDIDTNRFGGADDARYGHRSHVATKLTAPENNNMADYVGEKTSKKLALD